MGWNIEVPNQDRNEISFKGELKYLEKLNKNETNQSIELFGMDDTLREIAGQPKIGMTQYTEKNPKQEKTVGRFDSTPEQRAKIGNATNLLIVGTSSNSTGTSTWTKEKVKTQLHDLA